MLEFKDLIKRERKKKRLTQKKVADLIGIGSRNYTLYQSWEYGQTLPDAKNLLKLIEVLGLDPEEVKEVLE